MEGMHSTLTHLDAHSQMLYDVRTRAASAISSQSVP